MGGKTMKEELRQLCDDLDEGRAPRRVGLARRLVVPLAVPAAIGLAAGLGAAACDGDEGGVEDVCDDEIDNDDDGQTDCEDSDCLEDDFCAVGVYGFPFEGRRGAHEADPDLVPPLDPSCFATPDAGAPFLQL